MSARWLAGSLMGVLLTGSANVLAQAAPSNAELYQMMKALSDKLDTVVGENAALKRELGSTRAELRATKAELDAVREAAPATRTASAPSAATASAEAQAEPTPPWELGAQLLILSPFDTGHAFTVTRTSQSPAPASPLPSDLTTTEISFDHGFDLSPRLWLGYRMESGAGFRGTFWYTDHDEANSTGFDASTTSVNASASAGSASTGAEGSGGVSASFDVPALLPSGAPAISPGSSVRATQSIELMTVDLELTKEIRTARPVFDLSAGLRYAMIDQAYRVELVGTPLGPNVSTLLVHEHDFHGIGPTAGLRMTYPDVLVDGLSISGALRGAVMFGEREHSLVGLPVGTNNGTVDKDDTVGVLGMGIGLGYTVQDLPRDVELELEAGWEGQYWFNAYDANLDSGDIGLQGFYLGGRLRW